jgi:hypothetical protein
MVRTSLQRRTSHTYKQRELNTFVVTKHKQVYTYILTMPLTVTDTSDIIMSELQLVTRMRFLERRLHIRRENN